MRTTRLAVADDKPLNQHQADERLAEADAVAEKRAAMLAGDLHQGLVAVLLVLIQDGVHAGTATLALAFSHSSSVISWPR